MLSHFISLISLNSLSGQLLAAVDIMSNISPIATQDVTLNLTHLTHLAHPPLRSAVGGGGHHVRHQPHRRDRQRPASLLPALPRPHVCCGRGRLRRHK